MTATVKAVKTATTSTAWTYQQIYPEILRRTHIHYLKNSYSSFYVFLKNDEHEAI